MDINDNLIEKCIRYKTKNFEYIHSYNLKNTGDRFRFLREELTEGCGKNGKCMSMRELADFFYRFYNDIFQKGAAYSHSRIERIENNKSIPTKLDLQLYHKLFGVPYEFLLSETKSLKYENMDNEKFLGLSDISISRLKSMANSDDKSLQKCLSIINNLFESDNGNAFYEMLYNYFYFDVSDIYPNNKIKESDIFEIKIFTSDKKELNFNYSTSIDIENINRQAFYFELEKMKNEIKSFGYKPENIKNDEFTIYKTRTEKYKAGELVKAIQKSNKKAKKKKNKKKTTLSTDKNDT